MTMQIETLHRKPIRVYADTSVYGGVFDVEFANPSRIFFEQVEQGYFSLVTSAFVQQEIKSAPIPVQNLYQKVVNYSEIINISDNVTRLHQADLQTLIISANGLWMRFTYQLHRFRNAL